MALIASGIAVRDHHHRPRRSASAGHRGVSNTGGRPPDPPRPGGRVMAAAVLPLLLASSTLAGQNAAHDTTSQQPQDCILWILCLPSPAPSPKPTTQPASPSPGRTPQPSTSAGLTSGSQAKSKTAAGRPGVEASTATSVIVAGSATLDGMSYQGTTQVPTASGTVTMMKFTMSSLTLTGGVRATVTQNGQATVTNDSSLDFSGG